MYVLFQYLLIISLNFLLSKISCTILLVYCNIFHIYNMSPFLTKHNVFGHQKINVEVLRHTVHEDTSV